MNKIIYLILFLILALFIINACQVYYENSNSQNEIVYLLAVNNEGTGSGTINSISTPEQVNQINCDINCDAQQVFYPANTQVVLEATASSGSKFNSWDGACSYSTGSTCTLIMDSEKIVTAYFSTYSVGTIVQ